MKKLYDYDSNNLSLERKNGISYNLHLRGNVTIIDGPCGSGKSVLFKDIDLLKNIDKSITDIDVSNIITVKTSDIKINDIKVLYIIDRADKILTSDLCDKICSCNYARFLIFARGSHPLGVSPNHFGSFVRNGDSIYINYEFNEVWW